MALSNIFHETIISYRSTNESIKEFADEISNKKILNKHQVYFEMIERGNKFQKSNATVDLQTVKWMQKRGYMKGDRIKMSDQIEFAKKLFYSWDDDGSGILEIDEI